MHECDIDDSCSEDDEKTKQSGYFRRLNASVKITHITPKIDDGVLTHTLETALFARASDRQYQDDEARHRNYQVLELGASLGRRSNSNSRLSVPISMKRIQLDGDDLAHFYEGKVSYGFNTGGTRLTFWEKLSYRDYQRFSDSKENALLLETNLSAKHPISSALTLKSQLSFSLLNTDNAQHLSYDRFKGSLGIGYKVSRSLSFGMGAEYQKTDYKGLRDYPELEEEQEETCFGLELCFDFNRQDNYQNLYLASQFTFNANWSIKGRVSKAKRDSNQGRYDYTRTTLSAGIYVKF